MKTKLATLGLYFTLIGSMVLAQDTAFTYQGRLDDAGAPASGSYDLQFAVYAAASAGSRLGNPLTNGATIVSNGLFAIRLDFGAETFSGADRWLELSVRTNGGTNFTLLSPRQQITAVPYAITAGTVTGPIHGAAILAGTITGAQLAGATITTFNLASNSVTASQLAPGAAAANLDALGQRAGGRTPATARLISDLKQEGLFADLVFLQVYGRSAQDISNSITLRGPRQPLIGGANYTFGLSRTESNTTNIVIHLPTALSNVTLFTAMAGAEIPESGLERNILGIHSPGAWPWTSLVRFYKSSGNTLSGQTAGGGGQAFWSPTTSVGPYTLTPHTYALALDVAANLVQLSVDGGLTPAATYTHGDPTGMTAVDFGAGTTMADTNLKGTYALQAVWNRALASNELVAVDAIVRRTVLPQNNIVFEGDSITDTQVNGLSFWAQLFGSGSDWSLAGSPVSIATGGHSTSSVTNEWPAQLLPYAPTGNVERGILVLWIGANDVGNYSAAARSNAEIFANIRQLWAQAKAAGFEVAAVTIFRLGSAGRQRTNCEGDVLALNDLIRADHGINYDYLVDVETAMTAAAGEGYWTNAAYFPDGVHPTTPASRNVILEAFKPVGRSIFP